MKFAKLFEEQLKNTHPQLEDGLVYYCVKELAEQMGKPNCLDYCVAKAVEKDCIHRLPSFKCPTSKAKYLSKYSMYKVWKLRMEMDGKEIGELAEPIAKKLAPELSHNCKADIPETKEVITAEKLTIFKNSQFGSVRVIMIDGEPWFIGKDVAVILGYTNPQKAIGDHVDEEDRRYSKTLPHKSGESANIINESGLYSLILLSKLPKAKMFKRWVTKEVLPSLRKTGTYGMASKKDSYTIEDPIERAQAWIAEKQAMIALETENKQMRPKVAKYEAFCDDTELITVTGIADKFIECDSKEVNKILVEEKIIRPVKSSNGKIVRYYELNRGYSHLGKKMSYMAHGFIHYHLKYYPKGVDYICDLLIKHGYMLKDREYAKRNGCETI